MFRQNMIYNVDIGKEQTKPMPNYDKLRELVSIASPSTTTPARGSSATSPRPSAATGPVQVLVMSRVDILDDKGRVLEHHDEFSFVPNVMIGFRLTEGPSASHAGSGPGGLAG